MEPTHDLALNRANYSASREEIECRTHSELTTQHREKRLNVEPNELTTQHRGKRLNVEPTHDLALKRANYSASREEIECRAHS